MIDDPLSLLSLAVWLMAAGMWPVAFMLGTDCSGCCCEQCCWKVTSYSGCPGPVATLEDDGREVLLCFQDSGNCGTQSCEELQKAGETAGCAAETPCSATQTISMRTSLRVQEPVTMTVVIEGLVETVDPGYDETTVEIDPVLVLNEEQEQVASVGAVTIGSSMGETGGGTCAMNFVRKTEQFSLPAGCIEISIASSTRDALWHFGMYSKITFSFSDESKVASCGAALCTEFVCEDGTCTPLPTDGGGVTLEECVEECSAGECTSVGFYCCVEGNEDRPRRCVPRRWRICDTSESGFIGTKSSDEKNKQLDPEDGLFPLDEPIAIPADAFETLQECRQACPTGYECVNNVCEESDGEDPTYETLEDCEEQCLGKFDCNEFGECIQTGDEASPYDTRQQCEQNCQHGYACAANGVCYRVANGPFETKELCEAACAPNVAGKYYCVSENGGTTCKKGPLQENEVVLSGPHNGIADCQFWCRKHTCVDLCGFECVAADDGEFQTLASCLQDCDDPAAGPCTLQTTTGVGPGTFLFNIDGAQRDVCISYLSVRGQPVQVQGVYVVRNPVTCKTSGIARANSGWRGYAPCDCRLLRAPGPLRGGPKGFVSFRKPKGITSFYVVVLAPCPGTEVRWTVRCEKGPCSEEDDDEPVGACCVDGECSDDVAEADCVGDWFGPCTRCDDEGVQCDPRGACCYPDGSCLQKTAATCAAEGGAYQGDGVACFQVFCPQPDRGACCFREGCAGNVTQEQCEIFGGTYLGDGSTCDPPDPCAGACCAGGECVEVPSEADCVDILEGAWQGRETKCEETECACESDEDCPEGQCCYNGECSPCGACGCNDGKPLTNVFVAIGEYVYDLTPTVTNNFSFQRCTGGSTVFRNWFIGPIPADTGEDLPAGHMSTGAPGFAGSPGNGIGYTNFERFGPCWRADTNFNPQCEAYEQLLVTCIDGALKVFVRRIKVCLIPPKPFDTGVVRCSSTRTWEFLFTQYTEDGCPTGSAALISNTEEQVGDLCGEAECEPLGNVCADALGDDEPSVQIGNPFP
jgi:hypothetical protein